MLLPVIGIQTTLVAIGTVYLSVALLLALDRGLYGMDEPQSA